MELNFKNQTDSLPIIIESTAVKYLETEVPYELKSKLQLEKVKIAVSL